MSGNVWAEVRRPSKTFKWLNHCELASGAPLRFPVHILAGAEEGPTLAILATQHGNEVRPLGSIVEFINTLEVNRLRGTVVVVPIANPMAFEAGSRNTWIDGLYGDHANLNRVWPGKRNGCLTERLAAQLTEEIIRPAQYLIDVHDGTRNMGIFYSYLWNDDSRTAKTANELSLAFGMEILVRYPPEENPLTLCSWALTIDLPAIGVELGYFAGWDQAGSEGIWVREPTECGTTGFNNALIKLGMLEGRMRLPARQLIVEPEYGLGPTNGGLLFPKVTARSIGRTFPKGTVLARILSPYTLAELETLTAPFDETLVLAAPHEDACYRVNPGSTADFGYWLADGGTAEWKENPV